MTRLATSPERMLRLLLEGVKENGEHVTAGSHGSEDRIAEKVFSDIAAPMGVDWLSGVALAPPEQKRVPGERVRSRLFTGRAVWRRSGEHTCGTACDSMFSGLLLHSSGRHITGNKCAYTITNSLLS